jgi:hypothetical protein
MEPFNFFLRAVAGNKNDVIVFIFYLVSDGNDVTITFCSNDAQLWKFVTIWYILLIEIGSIRLQPESFSLNMVRLANGVSGKGTERLNDL